MKSIKNVENGEIRRVENKEAEQRNGYGWVYIAKSFWKALRGTSKVTKTEEIDSKVEKKTKRTTGDNNPYSKKNK